MSLYALLRYRKQFGCALALFAALVGCDGADDEVSGAEDFDQALQEAKRKTGGTSSGGAATGGTTNTGGAGGTGGTAGAGGTSGLSSILSSADFAAMFPNRNSLYAYDGLIAAAHAYPAFASEGTATQRLQEVAAFLANIGHETTGGWETAPGGPYAWGLYWTEELGCAGKLCSQYCAQSSQYPCASGKSYHGRGPMQISWNYNYGQAGDALGLQLLSFPEQVLSSGTTAFKTALWFWMTPQAPKPSAHAVMTGSWQPTAQDQSNGRLPGFGMTINIVNGALECGMTTPAAVTDRVGFYQAFTTRLAVPMGSNLYCNQMAPYN